MDDLSGAQSGIMDELKADPVTQTENGVIARKPDGTHVEISKEGEVKDVADPTEPGPQSQAGAAAEDTSRALTTPTAGAAITQAARYGFEKAQITAIRNTVASECNDAELVMFLENAARYELDPFAKQIYAAKIKGRVQIIVSRDGLLALAHRQESFERMDGDVVHANDEFASGFSDGKRIINHSYGTKDRGEIIGAWARVVRKGHGETFFFAPWGEYVQDREGPWKKTPSAMILKCAETYALRKAFSVSGVVGEDEVEKERKNLTAVDAEGGTAPDLTQARRGHYILWLARIANELQPGAYRPAKLRALAADPDGLVDELANFITQNGGEVPDEPIDAEAEEEVDGEVVEAATAA